LNLASRMNALYKLQKDMGMNKQSTTSVPTRLRVKPSPYSSDAKSEKISSDSFSALVNGQNGFDAQKAEEKYTAQGSRKVNRDAVPVNKEKENSAYPAPSLSERAPMLYSNLQSYISSRKLSADKVQDPSVGSPTPVATKAFKTASPSPSPQGVSGGNGAVDLSTDSGALEVGDILGTTMNCNISHLLTFLYLYLHLLSALLSRV
jgi:hypothetical protein